MNYFLFVLDEDSEVYLIGPFHKKSKRKKNSIRGSLVVQWFEADPDVVMKSEDFLPWGLALQSEMVIKD